MRCVLFELFRVSVAMMIQLANARSAGCESGMRQRGSFDEKQDVLIITEMIDRLDEGRLSRRRAPACPLPACVLPRDLIDETRNIIPQRRVSLGRQYASSSSLRPKMKGPFILAWVSLPRKDTAIEAIPTLAGSLRINPRRNKRNKSDTRATRGRSAGSKTLNQPKTPDRHPTVHSIQHAIQPKEPTLYSSMTPNLCPTLTFFPASATNLNPSGASKTRTIVLPNLNPPISSPAVRG
jgi:hypothetical protein